MVSGLVTSPCDQLRIFSGDARLMRMASKSAIVFCISNGLERNKVFLRFLLPAALADVQRPCQFSVSRWSRALSPRNVPFITKTDNYEKRLHINSSGPGRHGLKPCLSET